MSHNIQYFTYSKDVNKKQVNADIDNYVAHEDYQEGCSGLYSPIRWIDKILDTYEDAEEYINSHDKGDYDSLAVMYYEYPKFKETKTYEVLKERAERLKKRYLELRDRIHYADVKSKFITCRFCESKISTDVLSNKVKSYAFWGKRNDCPVCGRDLRPESALDIIEKARQNAEKAEKDLKAERRKIEKKLIRQAEIKWLVKIEYHT